MRVLQLIDSLNTGGAERVAVNYANSLLAHVEESFLCVTRTEGLLKESLSTEVRYLFLNKKYALDFKAIKNLNNYVKHNRIDVIHAHSSSFFIGTFIKFFNPSLVLIWHDHYGKSEFLNKRPKFILKWCSFFFDHVIAVNGNLEVWSKEVLKVKLVNYLPNFAVLKNIKPGTRLKGDDDKRIICLANLRPQKDHITLINAFELVLKHYPDWTLHLVGKDFNDNYSNSIYNLIRKKTLEKNVFVYGSRVDTYNILKQSSIGVLSSISEGLPVALLEYGLANLPVIATNVGDCNKVISNKDEGLLIKSGDVKILAEALLVYIENEDLMKEFAEKLHHKVVTSFSEKSVLEFLISIYKKHKK